MDATDDEPRSGEAMASASMTDDIADGVHLSHTHGNIAPGMQGEAIDNAQPWKETLFNLMAKFPGEANETYHAKLLIAFPDLQKQTLKNARLKNLKRHKGADDVNA